MKKVNIILLGGLENQLFINAANITIFRKIHYKANFHIINFLTPLIRFFLKK
jgi:hypothetical protein